MLQTSDKLFSPSRGYLAIEETTVDITRHSQSVVQHSQLWSKSTATSYMYFMCQLQLQQYYILHVSITIVQSYTGKYHEFVAVVLLLVRSTSNNAQGGKQVICFRYSFVAMVILILSYKRGIPLHVPVPMNVVNARYHSLLGDAISFLVSNSLH